MLELSEAQKDALKQVEKIASEHFEACVFVFSIESEDCKYDLTDIFHSGGFPTAFGLLELGKIQLAKQAVRDEE